MSANVSVTLKIATSLDARIALADGTSQWITGTDARARSHALRASHDGVVVGIGTVLADDPMLTARTVPLPERQPVRIVLDSAGRTPTDSRLVKSVAVGRVVVATAGVGAPWLAAEGVEVWQCGPADGQVEPEQFLNRCAVEGIGSLMIEGGGQVAAAFLRQDCVDRLEWFRAPILLGGDGIPAIGDLRLSGIGDASRWRAVATERIGDDVLESYVRA
jgi:diaminohydroxyphosphoribosylaminopyrimidine deaminase / 5-amino-6-(5-phosphoribosylamino)uracil reductase